VGGFVAGSRSLIEWLVNRARPYVFSTAGPAAAAAAAMAALDIVRQEPQRRQRLLARAQELRADLSARGWNVGASASQIIPLIVGDPARAVQLSAQLRDRGLFVPAIRPPTVPEGEACLRISLTAGHTEEMIAALLTALGHQ
jgi:8-amino-7-oxononanoate synthase